MEESRLLAALAVEVIGNFSILREGICNRGFTQHSLGKEATRLCMHQGLRHTRRRICCKNLPHSGPCQAVFHAQRLGKLQYQIGKVMLSHRDVIVTSTDHGLTNAGTAIYAC